jgi:hypothetical protein
MRIGFISQLLIKELDFIRERRDFKVDLKK